MDELHGHVPGVARPLRSQAPQSPGPLEPPGQIERAPGESVGVGGGWGGRLARTGLVVRARCGEVGRASLLPRSLYAIQPFTDLRASLR
jgi:hypothetical protein